MKFPGPQIAYPGHLSDNDVREDLRGGRAPNQRMVAKQQGADAKSTPRTYATSEPASPTLLTPLLAPYHKYADKSARWNDGPPFGAEAWAR